MKKIAVGLLTLVALFLLTVSSGFGWGTDVQIYPGRINCFDVDYDLGTGNIFLAFQATGEDIIRLYSSTDHGRHWAQITTFNTDPQSGTVPRADLGRIRVVYSEGKIHIFWVDSAGFLNKWSCLAAGTGHGGARVSPFPIMEGSFSVTMDPENGNLYTAYRTDPLPHSGGYKYTLDMIDVSTDDGRTWTLTYHPTGYIYQSGYSYRRFCLAFAPGAENYIYAAYTRSPIVDYPAPEGAPNFKQVYFIGPPSVYGEPFARWKNISAGAVDSIDARVTAAYVNDSGVWVVYNRGGHGGYNLDLLNAYSPDGGLTWSYLDRPVAAEAGVEEYVADLKYYRAPGNSYVNMVYIRRQPDSPQQAVWAYASTADPAWRGLEAGFNDREVKGYPEDVGPRLVYSPGAEAPGSGVVFSYRGANREASGLYFDAPWIVAAGGFLPVYPGLPVYPVVSTHTLTVTIHGSGSVVSSPAGLDCRSNSLGDKVCTHDFFDGTAVALTATPIDGSGYTSSFIGWLGDCSGHDACPLVMADNKSVEASFGALGTPAFALPVPAGQEAWDYPPVENPLLQPDPAHCKPFAVGDLMTGNLNLQVGLPPFSAGVDVYLAAEYSGYLFLVNDCNEFELWTPAMTELPRWKTNASSVDINESLYGDISLALLPTGFYNLYIAVVPTGETDFSHYYFWSTYFLAP